MRGLLLYAYIINVGGGVITVHPLPRPGV